MRSYAANAIGQSDPLVSPHALYQAMGACTHHRQAAYRGLFHAHIDDKTLETIRQVIQEGWTLGNDRLKDDIVQLLNKGCDHYHEKAVIAALRSVRARARLGISALIKFDWLNHFVLESF
jgi:hypothetical protein